MDPTQVITAAAGGMLAALIGVVWKMLNQRIDALTAEVEKQRDGKGLIFNQLNAVSKDTAVLTGEVHGLAVRIEEMQGDLKEIQRHSVRGGGNNA